MGISNEDQESVASMTNDSERTGLLESDEFNLAERYERIIVACGFGKMQVILLFICGWALASDSTEVQVVSFVLPAACDLEMTSSQKGLLNAIIFVGMMIGGYAFGGAADLKGRRFVLLWSMTINGVFGLVSGFAPNFGLFLVFRLLSGVGVGAALPVLFSYYVEFIPKDKRGPSIGFLASFWMIGNILTSGIAWFIIPKIHLGGYIDTLNFGSWRIFVVIGSFPAMSSALLFFCLPESPKYLYMNGRYEEARDVFLYMFKTNHKDVITIPPEINECVPHEGSLQLISDRWREDPVDSDMCTFCQCICGGISTLKKVFRSTVMLFKYPLTRTSVILVIVWFTLSFGYYGLWMWFPELFERIDRGGSSCGGDVVVNTNTSAIVIQTCLEKVASSTDVYFNSFLIALSNLPGNIFTILFINKIGRRSLLALSMILSAISVFFFWLVKTKVQMIAMSCIFSGLSVAGWNALDAVALENYPTNLRSSAFGMQASVGRLAAILGNLVFGELVDVHCSVPILLVAGLLCGGGLSVFKLPKTDNAVIN